MCKMRVRKDIPLRDLPPDEWLKLDIGGGETFLTTARELIEVDGFAGFLALAEVEFVYSPFSRIS